MAESLHHLRKSPSIIPVHRSLLRKSPSIIPVRRSLLRKSPSIITVHRSLLGSSPNPKYPHPDQYHARFPSTAARAFSTGSGSESDQRPHWSAKYRRILGIGDAQLIRHRPAAHRRPPKEGEIKINLCTLPDNENHNFGWDRAWFHAVARNSAGDLLGTVAGIVWAYQRDELQMELSALKAAARLAKELERTGAHDGPVVYETLSPLAVSVFHDECEYAEKILRRSMPPEGVFPHENDMFYNIPGLVPIKIWCGSKDRLREMLPAELADLYGLGEIDDAPSCKNESSFLPCMFLPTYVLVRAYRAINSTRTLRLASTHTKSDQSDDRPHWSTVYRRRLGIDDALVIRHHRLALSPPPKDGAIKINFYVDGKEETAVATNSSGDVLGVTEGSKNKYTGTGNVLEFQLYALKASADLAKRLKSTGVHDGPVVYVTSYALLARCFHDLEDEDVLRSQMPRDEDLEEFGRSCRIQCWRERSPCHRPQCETECRRRLGIGDARVIKQPPIALWRPPVEGEIKISFYADLADDGNKGDGQRDEYHDGGVITAVARDSWGDLLGVTTGLQRYKRGDEIGLQLYALKAASNLAGELKRTGRHDGPVVYESAGALLVRSLHEDCEDLMSHMPPDQDLEGVGRSCPTHCRGMGRGRGGGGLRELLPASVASLFDAQERFDAFSGLT